MDTTASPAAIAERYSWRWPIEPSNATGKQLIGAGDACNRVQKAVERTVPFAFLVQSLLICWYARCGDQPADIERRRLLCPWYQAKTEPAPADMLTALRREFLKARFSVIRTGRGCRTTSQRALSSRIFDTYRPRSGGTIRTSGHVPGANWGLTLGRGGLCDSLGHDGDDQINLEAWTCDSIAA